MLIYKLYFFKNVSLPGDDTESVTVDNGNNVNVDDTPSDNTESVSPNNTTNEPDVANAIWNNSALDRLLLFWSFEF